VSDILAAANMRRLLEAYRNLAPLTIGGPSSTSLETPGTPLSSRPPHTFPDPRLLRKFAHYPWLLGAQGMPPGLSPALLAKSEDAVRRRHASCDSMVAGGRPGQRLSPSAPVFSSKDRESSSLKVTQLEGQSISCFTVGGEDRLCLTQLLQLVLHSQPLSKIHQACDQLQIFCSTCTPAQLAALKLARVLPISAAQCGLITKSDAERLCSLLLQATHSTSPLSSPPPPSTSPAVSPPRADQFTFRVQHKCFGDCVGLLHPQAFTAPGARCIECTECSTMLSPQRFVCHTHQAPETRTCHWGFDSANWAAYIQVAEDYGEEERERLQEELSSVKRRFSHNKVKRKWIENDQSEAKRHRQEEDDRGRETQLLMPPNPHRFPPGFPPTPEPHNPLPPHAPLFLPPLGLPLPPDKSPVFPGMIDPRPLYMQWAAAQQPMPSPFMPGMQQPNPGYLQSLAQFHNLKALATKTLLEQQTIAKTLLQASLQSCESSQQGGQRHKSDEAGEEHVQAGEQGERAGGQISEYVVSVSAVLETTGVDQTARQRVMGVVGRLVDRLARVEEEKDSATMQLKGMAAKCTRLEKELEERSVDKLEGGEEEEGAGSGQQPSYESSSDLGIESGTEVEDSLSEK